jgi:hypothetical protein
MYKLYAQFKDGSVTKLSGVFEKPSITNPFMVLKLQNGGTAQLNLGEVRFWSIESDEGTERKE